MTRRAAGNEGGDEPPWSAVTVPGATRPCAFDFETPALSLTSPEPSDSLVDGEILAVRQGLQGPRQAAAQEEAAATAERIRRDRTRTEEPSPRHIAAHVWLEPR